jgi:hypothetical protein
VGFALYALEMSVWENASRFAVTAERAAGEFTYDAHPERNAVAEKVIAMSAFNFMC